MGEKLVLAAIITVSLNLFAGIHMHSAPRSTTQTDAEALTRVANVPQDSASKPRLYALLENLLPKAPGS